jgi:hypothetical protein
MAIEYFIGIDLNRWYKVKRGEYDADAMVNTRIQNNQLFLLNMVLSWFVQQKLYRQKVFHFIGDNLIMNGFDW